MKIIIGIDGPRDLDLIEEYTGLEGGDKHHDQRKRLREAKKTESNDLKKREEQIKQEKRINRRIEMSQEKPEPKLMMPLHVICMHLYDKQEVLHGALTQLYVLQGNRFNDAYKKATELMDKQTNKQWDNYENVNKVLSQAAEGDTELIILHSKINGGVAHNRNMCIHYIVRHRDEFKDYTHIHFMDYDGQFGIPFIDDGIIKIQGIELNTLNLNPETQAPNDDLIHSMDSPSIPEATNDMYMGDVFIKDGKQYKLNKVTPGSSISMSLWSKYIPISDIKKGFSFINADMNEDLFMLQQINRVPRDGNYRHVDSLQYYNGLSEHPNPVHIKDLIMASENMQPAIETISKLWTQIYFRVSKDEFNEFIDAFKEFEKVENKTEESIISILNELNDNKPDKYKSIIDSGKPYDIRSDKTHKLIKPFKFSYLDGQRGNLYPYVTLDNGYTYIHLTRREGQGKGSNPVMKTLFNWIKTSKNYSFNDLYVSPIPILKSNAKGKYVFIPLYSYLEYMHPTNSYIIEYTINKLGMITTDFMSADVFGEVTNDETGIRSGWIKKKGVQYDLLERSPVRISIDGTIHINPLFITDASEPGYVEYLQFICDFNAAHHKLMNYEGMTPYSSPSSSERMMSEDSVEPISELEISDVKGGDKNYDKFNYYTIKHGDIDYELAIYKNKSIHYDVPPETSYHDFPEAFHAKIFGGKIGLGLTIILLILVLITVLIIVIIKDGNNQKRLYDPHLRYDI